jgi:hypothetical protein
VPGTPIRTVGLASGDLRLDALKRFTGAHFEAVDTSSSKVSDDSGQDR